MVRRLSFINNFNSARSYNFNTQSHSHTDVCMNTVFYLRKPFKFTTKHTRRYWRRRKHNFEYVLYTNILNSWSVEYVFFRNNIKFTYNYCITKSSLVAYNLAELRGTIPALAKNSEHVYLSTLTKVVIRYFYSSNIPTYAYWQHPVNTLITFSSFYKNAETDEIFKTCLISPSFVYSTSTLHPYSNDRSIHSSESYEILFNSIFETYSFQWISEIYKISTLLALDSIIRKI